MSAAARLVTAFTVAAVACAGAAGSADAAGGRYTIHGGTAPEQAQVRAALDASSFDWSIVPPVSIRISRSSWSSATPGQIVLDAHLLDAGRFSWGVVQHEYAHEVDFLVLDDADRTRIAAALGGGDWWPAAGVAHRDLTSERFASTLAWAYWPSPDNVMQPTEPEDEAGWITPSAFRTLLAQRHFPVRIY